MNDTLHYPRNMSPASTTRGLSLCCALLVNAAAGTMRRSSVLVAIGFPSTNNCRGYRRGPHKNILLAVVPPGARPFTRSSSSNSSRGSRWHLSRTISTVIATAASTTTTVMGFVVPSIATKAADSRAANRIDRNRVQSSGCRSTKRISPLSLYSAASVPSIVDSIGSSSSSSSSSSQSYSTRAHMRMARMGDAGGVRRTSWTKYPSSAFTSIADLPAAAGEAGVGEFSETVVAAAGGEDRSEKPLTVTLLSGFLGAGKTTLMRNVLRQARAEGLSVAIIVNDMADVNIDAQLLVGEEEAAAGEIGSDIRSVGERETAVAMQDGCICCTLREELILEVEAIAREGRHDHLIIESTGISDPTPVAEAFEAAAAEAAANTTVEAKATTLVSVDTSDGNTNIGNDERVGRGFSLDTLVTVVDSTSFLHEIRKADELQERGLEAEEWDTRTVADLLVSQVEFANVILLNKADLVSSAEDIDTIEEVVRRLNPASRVIRTVSSTVSLAEVMGTGEFNLEETSQAAGWLQTLNDKIDHQHYSHDDHQHIDEVSNSHGQHGSHSHDRVHGSDYSVGCNGGGSDERKNEAPVLSSSTAATRGPRRKETFGIGSFTFRARRPFHPERLFAFVMEHLPSVIRSKGFLWLATRHDMAGVWNQAGGSFATEYGGSWDNGDGFISRSAANDAFGGYTGNWNKLDGNGDRNVDVADVEVGGGNGGGDGVNSARNELVFIGLISDMKEDILLAELGRCLLTDAEMKGGPADWKAKMADPFPPWEEDDDDQEEE